MLVAKRPAIHSIDSTRCSSCVATTTSAGVYMLPPCRPCNFSRGAEAIAFSTLMRDAVKSTHGRRHLWAGRRILLSTALGCGRTLSFLVGYSFLVSRRIAGRQFPMALALLQTRISRMQIVRRRIYARPRTPARAFVRRLRG